MASAEEDPEAALGVVLDDKPRIEELPADEVDFEDVPDHEPGFQGVPLPDRTEAKQKGHVELPPWLVSATVVMFHDDHDTVTTEAQKKTTAECLPLLKGVNSQVTLLNSYGLPRLRRQNHVDFLRSSLGKMPEAYAVVDASRPWLFYWALAGLSFLGEDISEYRLRLMETVRPLQNPTGGFGGGHGQFSHCAGTYATILALAVVGGLEVVNRRAVWHWLGAVKQSDGGFCMAVGAEEDIRGAYCAMTVITLLNLPLTLPPDAPARKNGLQYFTDGLGEWIGRCQTYEGGIAGAPTNEAHGAYAFCALACLSILDAPHKSIPKYVDLHGLVHCLTNLQTRTEGGFAGRTNKLVDACYSHWVGGCWSLIHAALSTTDTKQNVFNDLWNREALIRYLLCCCQQPGKKGGMRDKPSARPDAYHTCYSIAGLSAATNHYHYNTDGETVEESTGRLTAAFNWTATFASAEERRKWKIDNEDTVEMVNPVFVLPMDVVERTRKQFERCEI